MSRRPLGFWKRHFYTIIPTYPSGRRVWLFVRVSWRLFHVEVGKFCVNFGQLQRGPKLARWQRAAPCLAHENRDGYR